MLGGRDTIHVSPEICCECVDFSVGIGVVQKTGRACGTWADDGGAGSYKIVQLMQHLWGHLGSWGEKEEAVTHAIGEGTAGVDVDTAIGGDAGVVREDVGVEGVVIVTGGRRGEQACAPKRHGGRCAFGE